MAAPSFDLIETLSFDPDAGLIALDRHIGRLRASAAALGFVFDSHDTANELQTACFRCRDEARVRIRLAPSGSLAIEVTPVPPGPTEWRVAIVDLPVAVDDIRLRHKTSDRAFYDDARRASGCDEVVFVRPDGLLTEGSFTNLFIERDGRLLTPPLGRGLLPGVLRAALLEEGRAIEADLRAPDLTAGFLLGNSLRGLIRARLA